MNKISESVRGNWKQIVLLTVVIISIAGVLFLFILPLRDEITQYDQQITETKNEVAALRSKEKQLVEGHEPLEKAEQFEMLPYSEEKGLIISTIQAFAFATNSKVNEIAFQEGLTEYEDDLKDETPVVEENTNTQEKDSPIKGVGSLEAVSVTLSTQHSNLESYYEFIERLEKNKRISRLDSMNVIGEESFHLMKEVQATTDFTYFYYPAEERKLHDT